MLTSARKLGWSTFATGAVCAFLLAAVVPATAWGRTGLPASFAPRPSVPLSALLAVQDPAATPTPPADTAGGPADGEAASEAATPAPDGEEPEGLRRVREPAPDPSLAAEATAPVVEEEETNVFTTWWFWVLTAAIVGGTVALGVMASQPTDKPANGCMAGYLCFGDGRQ